MSHLFAPRSLFKPFEYPEASAYKDAINHSYWLVSEWNFISDIQEFSTVLAPHEKNAIKNALLAISQIEIAVKRFWANLGTHVPKPEFDQVGVTFAESEVRHADAYSHLLQVLGLNEDFALLNDVPAIQARIAYLNKYLQKKGDTPQGFLPTLALFSILTENVSLFSQFVVIKSFNKHRNVLKDIDNVVQATQKEELIHGAFGTYLLNQVQLENPEWFSSEFYEALEFSCHRAFAAESSIIDWILEAGDLEFLSRDVLKEFLKDRFNLSLVSVGGNEIFEVNQALLSELDWFNDEIYAEVNTDFFYKKPVSYAKKVQPITAGDLF